jgi:hypothetical protein
LRPLLHFLLHSVVYPLLCLLVHFIGCRQVETASSAGGCSSPAEAGESPRGEDLVMNDGISLFRCAFSDMLVIFFFINTILTYLLDLQFHYLLVVLVIVTDVWNK